MLGINFIPSKYWAMVFPSIIVLFIFTFILSYMALNMYSTISPRNRKSLQGILFSILSGYVDEYTRFLNLKKTELQEGLPEVYDIPAPVANNVLYY